MSATRTLNKAIFTPSLYQSIRDLWFSGLPWGSKSATEEATQRWFTGSKDAKAIFDKLCHQQLNPAISSISPANFPIKGLSDAEIATPFVAEIEAAECGGETGAETKTKTALSLMLLLDQIPRNLYRTKETLPLVYEHYDPIAVSLARHITSKPVGDSRLDLIPEIRNSLPYRQWFYMPLMHSEKLSDHKILMELVEEMKEENKGDDEVLGVVGQMERFELMHLKIIERFGRYPHRNDCLGRAPTDEEREWLENGGEKFGVGG